MVVDVPVPMVETVCNTEEAPRRQFINVVGEILAEVPRQTTSVAWLRLFLQS